MIEMSGVSFGHELTVYGEPVLSLWLANRLTPVKDLPPAARRALPNLQRDPTAVQGALEIADALVAASGDEELPWSVLGRLVRETQFINVQRRADFLANHLGVDASEYVRQYLPLVKNHPYRGLIEIYGLNHPGPSQMREKLKDIVVPDPVPTLMPLYRAMDLAQLHPANQEPGEHLTYTQWDGRWMDGTSIDLERILRLRWSHKNYEVSCARDLADASPHSPVYMAKMIELRWPFASEHLKEWEQTWGDHPTLAAALGKQYTTLKQWPEAEKYLKIYLAKAPDRWAYEMLANNYLTQGDEAKWLSTLTEALEHPDYALDHAMIQSNIAWHFINKREFAKAKPYADGAAGSYSSWGLLVAAYCEEGLGHWDVAEDLIRRNAERYEKGMSWFEWCMRTGKGDLRSAEQLALQTIQSPRGDDEGREALTIAAGYHLFKGQTAEAEKTLDESFRKYNDTWSGMQLAVLREAARDFAARDAILQNSITSADQNPPSPGRPNPQSDWVRPRIAELARVYQQGCAAGPAGKLDLTAVEKVLRETDWPRERQNMCYFIGRILQLRGDKEAALTYLNRAAGGLDKSLLNCGLAWIELRKLGFDPAALYKTGEGADPYYHE
jgi:tetratricopeptide (TPR) repeat protein